MRLPTSIAITLFAGCACLAVQASNDSPLKAVVEQPFYVAGWEVRTSNASEMSGGGKIGPLWQRLMQQNLSAQIPNRTSSALFAVYSNYASDEKGEYD
jgi:predicted transcriptional regulator YdeE